LKKRLAIIERNGQFVAGVFTEKGLYSTALPGASKSAVISNIGGSDLPLSSNFHDISILEKVYQIYIGQEDTDIQSIALDLSDMSEKQLRVMKTAMKIPKGTTISYGELARKAGFPNAARFVGNVMAKNRLAPVIPCHRVVSASGLGGYGPGIDVKIAFLKREGAIAD